MFSKNIFSLLLFGIFAPQNGRCFHCTEKVKKLGCFKHFVSPFTKMELQFTNHHFGARNLRVDLNDLICNCADAAKKKHFRYFGIQRDGKCLAGDIRYFQMMQAQFRPSKRSFECETPLGFPCTPGTDECYGTDRSIHVYRQEPKPKPRVYHVYVPLPTEKPKTEAPKKVLFYQPGVHKPYKPVFRRFGHHYYAGPFYDTTRERMKRHD